MALVNPNPSGWAANAKFTSTQCNLFGTQMPKALDKSTAGDTLSGAIAMASTASITASNPANIVAASSASVQSQAAGGIESTVVGGFNHAGGASDWNTFSATRSRTIVVPCSACAGVSAFTQAPSFAGAAFQGGSGGIGLALVNDGIITQGVSSISANGYQYLIPIRAVHNGATISSVTLNFKPATHTGLPSGQLSLSVWACTVTVGVAGTQSLNSGFTFVQLAAANTAAYNASASLVYTCNQNNVVNSATTSYFAIITDEYGTSNTLTGNYYGTLSVNYSAIANMAFP